MNSVQASRSTAGEGSSRNTPLLAPRGLSPSSASLRVTRFGRLEMRFWSRVDISSDALVCWPWIGTSDSKGYGRFPLNGNSTMAHRSAFRLGYGIEPGDKFVCHSCDNPICCNPFHLWLGTPRDNTADMIRKGRQRHPLGSDVHSARLTEDNVRYIRSSKRTLEDLAAEFGVTHMAVHYARTGKTWRHISEPAGNHSL